MNVDPVDPPRRFPVGRGGAIEIKDCARIRLDPDEQVTFVTSSGKEYDVAAKSWGFYATPSVNARLAVQGFKTALTRNGQGRHYVMLVDKERISDFMDYLAREDNVLVEWLDERAPEAS
jgi:hypothetical protein